MNAWRVGARCDRPGGEHTMLTVSAAGADTATASAAAGRGGSGADAERRGGGGLWFGESCVVPLLFRHHLCWLGSRATVEGRKRARRVGTGNRQRRSRCAGNRVRRRAPRRKGAALKSKKSGCRRKLRVWRSKHKKRLAGGVKHMREMEIKH